MVSKIKESKLDEIFSKWLRTTRDYRCEYCGFRDQPPTNKIQCSHFFSRVIRSTRYDPENCDVLCQRCHYKLEGQKNGIYYDWKLKRMGNTKFKALKRRAYQTLQVGGLTQKQKQQLLNRFTL